MRYSQRITILRGNHESRQVYFCSSAIFFFFIFYDMFPSVFNNCDEACMLMAVRIMLFVSVTKIIHILWRNDLNQSI